MTTSRPGEVTPRQRRVWVKSGVVEELDAKQQRLLDLVCEKIVFYYRTLHCTRPGYPYPLSLSRLMKLCRRSGHAVTTTLRCLANPIPEGSHAQPAIFYDRHQPRRNQSHRPDRIFLRKRSD